MMSLHEAIPVRTDVRRTIGLNYWWFSSCAGVVSRTMSRFRAAEDAFAQRLAYRAAVRRVRTCAWKLLGPRSNFGRTHLGEIGRLLLVGACAFGACSAPPRPGTHDGGGGSGSNGGGGGQGGGGSGAGGNGGSAGGGAAAGGKHCNAVDAL